MSKTGVQMKPNADKKNEFYLELDILIDIHVFMKRIMLRNTSKDLNYHKVLERAKISILKISTDPEEIS